MAKSKTAENTAAVYKTSRKWETNRLRKLARTLKAQPNNEQVKAAMKSLVYRRKTPNKREWSATWKRVAQLVKQFSGRFDRNCMNSNPKLAGQAMQESGVKFEYTAPVNSHKSMFSIECRANINSFGT